MGRTEVRSHSVANFPLLNTFADGDDLACAVRAWDWGLLRAGVFTMNEHEVAVLCVLGINIHSAHGMDMGRTFSDTA